MRGKPGVELKCSITQEGAEHIPIATMQSPVMCAADVVNIRDCGEQLAITACLWHDKST